MYAMKHPVLPAGANEIENGNGNGDGYEYDGQDYVERERIEDYSLNLRYLQHYIVRSQGIFTNA